ncbi:NBR1-Ig-like domain-containing protein [Pseudonocardia sp.]|uniref:NBR1-Ig-like domain-containing protein n=1 Tax=Pseudonocardia sp. TaxID=60912 RepID=UPI0026333E80|nr:NBR1-Ig-like domain-containing protein [Pseudonocardia sp.]
MDDSAPVAPPGKRGRRQAVPDPATGPVARFAHDLATLKIEAGDPSYDRMRAEFGAAASKSALSAAARGHELPSWETTWEFVRSLTPAGSDLDRVRELWRARWEAARAGATRRDAPPPPVERSARRIMAVGLVLGATVGGLLWLLVAAASAPPAPPIEGDAAAFVADVTIPDGSVVPGGEPFVKTWEIRNTGAVPWTGRHLERLPGGAGTACRTPDRVPVPPTAPGEAVRVSVTVDAPPGPATCTVHWKMVDGDGRVYFPKSRPLFFEVTVAG